MIITVGGIKGGSGKTTVATNLACIAAGKGADTLLVDADDQETSADFTAARKQDHPKAATFTCAKLTGKAVHTEVQQMAKKYTHVIIDVGGRDTTSQRAALAVSDILLVPFVPRSFDLWTLEKVASLVDGAHAVNPNLKAHIFLNRADPQGQGTDNAEAAEHLKTIESLIYLDTQLHSRKAFAHAASQGLAVTELTGKPFNPKAAEEMLALFYACTQQPENNIQPLRAQG
jgi:chromosome partitioning protein